MGNRTVVVFENDHLGLITQDRHFAENLHNAIILQNTQNKPIEVVGCGGSMVATICKVTHMSHKDTKVTLRLIGSNTHEMPE